MKTITDIKRYDKMSVGTCDDGSKIRFFNDSGIAIGTKLTGPFEERSGKYGKEEWAKAHNIVTDRSESGGAQTASGGGDRNISIEAQVALKEAGELVRTLVNAGKLEGDEFVSQSEAIGDAVEHYTKRFLGILIDAKNWASG